MQTWEKAQFSVGARFFNLFDHPNVAFPNANIDSNHEQSTQRASQPPIRYGSGQSTDASSRVIELRSEVCLLAGTRIRRRLVGVASLFAWSQSLYSGGCFGEPIDSR